MVNLDEALIEQAKKSTPSADLAEEEGAEGNASAVVDAPEAPKDDSIHSGIFRGVVSVENQAEVKSDAKLQALPGDVIGICPPLIITKEQIDELFDALTSAVDDTANILKQVA